MFHHDRIWYVIEVESIEALAFRIKNPTDLSQGFSVAGHPDYLFLNDSTGNHDCFTEYAVVKGGLKRYPSRPDRKPHHRLLYSQEARRLHQNRAGWRVG